MQHIAYSASVAALLALGFSGSALAQPITIKAGIANLDPNSSATPARGPFTPVDALSLRVRSQSTPFFSVAWDFPSTPWQAELALGLPPTHDVALVVLKPASVPGSVAAQDGTTIAKVRQVSPAVFVNYRFGDTNSPIRPFIGLGLNYTKFDKARSTAANDAINGGPTTIKLKDSKGLAFQLGVTANLGGPWSVTGVWSTAQAKTTQTSNTLGVERVADIRFHPSVFIVSVGYTF